MRIILNKKTRRTTRRVFCYTENMKIDWVEVGATLLVAALFIAFLIPYIERLAS